MKTGLTDINIVLDRSGSMSSVKSDTIGGFNTFLENQKAAPGDAHFTLAQFDDQYEIVFNAVPLAQVPPLTDATFVPRGSTALLDAIGRTIESVGARLASLPEPARPEKVILVVMTDGLENASREFDRPRIFSMITHQREKYGWQIAFIGANQDAIATGASIGVPASNTLSYAGTGDGTQEMMASLSEATTRYRSHAQPVGGPAPAAPAGFFTPEEDNA